MAVFTPNIPQATDLLSDSQPQIKNNFDSTANTINDDHYGPADLTANLGKHRAVTSPTPSPATHYATTTDTKLYGMQDAVAIGNIQYSRGPSNAVPTPVTCLQSSSAAISVSTTPGTTILNFTGLPYCYGYVIATGITATSNRTQIVYSFFWDGSIGEADVMTNLYTSQVVIQFVGADLNMVAQPAKTFTNVAWTLEFKRIWTPT